MGEKYSALLVEGMLQRIRYLQRKVVAKEYQIFELEDQVERREIYANEYRGRLADFEYECERQEIGCFGCRHLVGSMLDSGFYDCELMDKGMDIHSAFAKCDAWEGKQC